MQFSDFGSRTVIAAFDGGEITSDAGVVLLRERAKQLQLFERMADCFTDQRNPLRIQHQLSTLLSQRVCGIALGYGDINDHDTLRHDPAIKLLATPKASATTPVSLAGKATLNRLEHSCEAGNPRYHRMAPKLKALQGLFVELFLDSYTTPPDEITLDIDATDIKAHGHQENSFFHGYYNHRCFLPLYIFCGHHLLLAQLRPSDIDGAKGSRNVIRRIIKATRRRWPHVKILVRGDSGFAREPDALV